MIKSLLLLSCLCLFGFATASHADTIGPGSCSSCLGSSYTLTYTTTASPDVYDIFLTVDTSATTLPGDYLHAVAPKVSSSLSSVSLISAPATFNSVVLGGLGAHGCNGSGSGFFCTESSTTSGVPVGSGDVYNFEWALTLAPSVPLDTAAFGSSIKALYVNADGKQVGITSEPITLQPGTPTPVPEPESLLLVCTGMFAAAAALRQRFAH